MSKSKARVIAALKEFGLPVDVRDVGKARTAQEAADSLNVHIDQIAKSMIFRGETSGSAYLFLTAGGHQVDVKAAQTLAGEPLGRADAAFTRAETGFAIGGVAPLGHIKPLRTWFDRRLLDFDVVFAAAGTPHHVFPLPPAEILRVSSAQVADFSTKPKLM